MTLKLKVGREWRREKEVRWNKS